MSSNLREEFERFKIHLRNTEKEMQAYAERNPTKIISNTATIPAKRPPWNYGGTKRSMSNSVAQNEILAHTSSPICTRSRSRSRSVSRTVSPPTRLLPKAVLSHPSKNVVHKQTINAGDKQTIVEVSVKTKHQSRKSSLHPALTDDYLVGKFSNVGISSQDSKKCDSSSCINPGLTLEVKKEPSWSNILSQNPSHSTMPNGISSTRSCDVLTDPHKKRKLTCHSNHGTLCLDSQKSSEVWHKEAHHQHNGERNIPIGVDPHRKLNFLIKELRGNSLNDPNLQRIILDMEEALANLPSENLGSPVISLSPKINGAQPTVQSQCNSPPTKLPSMVSQSHGLDCGDPVTEPSLLRLSPNPLSSEQHLPKRKLCAPKENWGALIQNFLEILNAVPESTSPPEGKHRTKKNQVKDDRPKFFKEQLEEACRTLETSCKRMENDCEKLKKDKAELEKILRDKERELQSALSLTHDLKAQHDEIQIDLQRTSKELQKIREEQTTKSRNNEHEENFKLYQRRLDELLEENKRQAIELSMSRLEKEKLSVMLSNAENEREKLMREIKDIQATVAEQLANIHSLSDHNKTLTQLDAMIRSLSKRSLLSDITLKDKNFDEGDTSNFKFENLNPVHSSPNSSVCTSELYTSWQRLSTITSEEESPKRRSKGIPNQKRKEKTSGKAKLRASAVGDIFTELKNKSSASAVVSLPSPPREIGLSFSGISHLTDESTHGSMTISEYSQSDTGSIV